jgi:hypothetical protein
LARIEVWPGRDVDDVDAGVRERLRDLHGLVRRRRPRHPVVRRDPHRHRLVLRPRRAHRAEHLEREAQPVLQRAAVLVRAVVGQRRDERRQQVAVRGVQLDHVEARLDAAISASTNCRFTMSMSARVISLRHLVVRRPRDRRRASNGQLPLGSGSSILPHQLRRALRAGVADLAQTLASVSRARSPRSASTRPRAPAQ